MSHVGIPKRHIRIWRQLKAQGWFARKTDWGYEIFNADGELAAQEGTWPEALEQVVMA